MLTGRLGERVDDEDTVVRLVYGLHMTRTNIEINERLIRRVMRRYGLTTKRAAVDLALRRLDLEPMSVEEALALRGTGWEGDLAELRGGYLGSTP